MGQILSAPLNGAGHDQPAGQTLRNRSHNAQTVEMVSGQNRTQSKINDWDEFQDALFDERRFPAIFALAGAFVVFCVLGTAFSF